MVVLGERTQIASSLQSLKSKIALANNFRNEIVVLFNTVLDQTQDGNVQPTRFNGVKAVIDASPNGFKNAFNNDLLQETGIDSSNVLAGEQPLYCQYARLWATSLAFLLSLNKVV